MPFLRVYFAFASGYLLSYLYRSVNAVISPELTRELELMPASLGLMTSAYFIGFASMQLPAGMLLDRYGPRRVEPVLLVVAGGGALLFALSDTLPGLLLARLLIGAGSAVCLMAPLKAIASWYTAERQASLAGWMMVAGSLGALLATTPLELALHVASWRMVFVALAFTTLAVAAWIFFKVDDTPRHTPAQGLTAQWAGVRSVFAHPRFWWITPLASIGMGVFMAVQGLWSVPWLMEVNGYDRGAAARHLLVAGVAILAGYVAIGLFASRFARVGIHAQHLFAAGFSLNAAAFAAIVAGLPYTYVWWGLYGFGSAANILSFTALCEGFSRALTGRANTAANLLMFGTTFAVQWSVGLIVEAARATLGYGTADGLRIAFATVLVFNVAALAWFAAGWRRQGGRPLLVRGA
jgi:predicted MFS family arabinose efflux permease